MKIDNKNARLEFHTVEFPATAQQMSRINLLNAKD